MPAKTHVYMLSTDGQTFQYEYNEDVYVFISATDARPIKAYMLDDCFEFRISRASQNEGNSFMIVRCWMEGMPHSGILTVDVSPDGQITSVRPSTHPRDSHGNHTDD